VALLQGLVIFGALLYVFGRGAKFSLFKPAEEMVYITLDEDGRTRGKAAIDVVGAQVRQLKRGFVLVRAGFCSASACSCGCPMLSVTLLGWSHRLTIQCLSSVLTA
jgi:hypothetical protein